MKITLSKEEVFEIINEYTKAKMNITTGVKGDSLDNLSIDVPLTTMAKPVEVDLVKEEPKEEKTGKEVEEEKVSEDKPADTSNINSVNDIFG